MLYLPGSEIDHWQADHCIQVKAVIDRDGLCPSASVALRGRIIIV
jgi:hypothetical protein